MRLFCSLLLLCTIASPSFATDHRVELAKALGLDEQVCEDPHIKWSDTYREAKALFLADKFEKLNRRLDGFPPLENWAGVEAAWVPYIFDMLAQKGQLEGRAMRWVRATPKSAHAHLTLGSGWINEAWEARGEGFANTVSEESWKIWREKLAKARKAVRNTLKRNPDHPVAHAKRLHLDRCQSTDRGESRAHFKDSLERVPTYFKIHEEALWIAQPRWGGTWEEVWETLDLIKAKIPSHPSYLKALYYAHNFKAESLGRHSDHAAAKRTYFRKPEIQALFRDLAATARETVPTSAIPANIEFELGKQVGASKPAMTQLTLEMARKGSVYWQIGYAKGALLRDQAGRARLRPADIKQAYRFLFLAIAQGKQRAWQIADKDLIGGNLREPKRPKATYHFCRVLGELGSRHWHGLAVELLRNGVGVKRDERAALAEHRRGAKAGDRYAQYHYGLILFGRSKASEKKAGIRHLERSAAQEHPSTLHILSEIRLGLHWAEAKDLEAADRWIRECERLKLPVAAGLRKRYEDLKAGEPPARR